MSSPISENIDVVLQSLTKIDLASFMEIELFSVSSEKMDIGNVTDKSTSDFESDQHKESINVFVDFLKVASAKIDVKGINSIKLVPQILAMIILGAVLIEFIKKIFP